MLHNTKLTIGWLYPKTMNLYGDRGNIIALGYECKQRNIDLSVKNIDTRDKFEAKNIDIAFFGGGQDKEQRIIAKDLQDKANDIKTFYNMKKPMLSICGGYQLLGNFFQTCDGKKIQGIGVFNVNTFGSRKRIIGNVIIRSRLFTDVKLVGFENHSGRTFLANKNHALGEVLKGGGNNGVDGTGGIISNNFIGTYLHGPFLPKNHKVCDWLIEKALEIKYNKQVKLKKLDDSLEVKARDYMLRNF